MKKLIFLMLLATSVAFGQQNAQGPKSQAKVLTRAEFDDLFSKPDQILIIDVRRPDEIKDIGGFPVYLNVQIGDLEKSLDWIPKRRTGRARSGHSDKERLYSRRHDRSSNLRASWGHSRQNHHAAGSDHHSREEGTLED